MREAETTFARRWFGAWSTRCALVVIVTWISVAVFAPFLANDRPLVMRAVDYGRFEEARASLVPVTRMWLDVEAQGPVAWRASNPARAELDFVDAVEVEKQALLRRIAIVRDSLTPDEDVLRASIDRLGSKVRGYGAMQDAGGVIELARSTAADLELDGQPGDEPLSAAGGAVRLASRVSAPVFAALTPLDIAFSAAWIALGATMLLLRTWRRRWFTVAIVFALALIAWPLARPLYSGPASIKGASARGDLVVDWALFPPIPMGFAETHMRDAFRAPFTSVHASASESSSASTWSGADFGRFSAEKQQPTALPFERSIDSRWRHPLGTDSLGRDLAARLVWGARISLFVGNAAALLLTVIGVALGLVAGWRGGWTDFCVSRATEIVVCFPAFVLVLCALFFIPPTAAAPLVTVAIVIGIVGWTTVARLVRAETLRVRELDFVAAARALGLTEAQILCRHVLPNAIQPAIIAFAFAVGAGVLTESALSFLGFGVQVPIPSWGALVSDSKSPDQAWIWLIPGCAIFTLVASYNVLGEALRDALDPKHER
ncbi:MAG: ABC transporter permease [Planctomycetota bacterium]|nr:ABC transporter permease [Planctomycetota bacterium]